MYSAKTSIYKLDLLPFIVARVVLLIASILLDAMSSCSSSIQISIMYNIIYSIGPRPNQRAMDRLTLVRGPTYSLIVSGES